MGFHYSHVMLLSFPLAARCVPHQRSIPDIPGEKFHFHTAISPATSPEYESSDHREMGATLPVGIIRRPTKTCCGRGRGFGGYKVIVETNLIYEGWHCCLEMIYLTSNERRPLLEFISVTALLIRK